MNIQEYSPKLREYSSKAAVALLGLFLLFQVLFLTRFVKAIYGGNPTSLMCIGKFLGYCPGVYHKGTYIRDDQGYDSQLYYYIALDPLLKHQKPLNCKAIDAYRYQRFLYPCLASALSLESWKAIPYAMIGINLLAPLLGAYVLMLLCDHYGVNRLFALFYAVSVPNYVGVIRTTAEPLYLLFLVVGFYFYIRSQDYLKSAVFFSLAVMTKEIALASVLGIVVYEALFVRDYKKLLYFALPFLTFALVQLGMYLEFGEISYSLHTTTNMQHVDRLYPLQGLVDKLASDLQTVRAFNLRQLFQPFILSNILLACAFIILNITQFKKYRHPFHFIGFFYVILAHLAADVSVSMTDIWGYGRHTAELFLCLIFLYLIQKQKALLIPLALNSAGYFLLVNLRYYQ